MENKATHTNKRFLHGVILNIAFILIEIFYGMQSNSVALIADAAHNAGDVFSLLIAWVGYFLAHKKTSAKFTFGFKKATIIAAFVNALLIFVAVGGIAWEAIQRLGQPSSVHSITVILVAAVGVLINGVTAYFFFHDRHNDINIQGAFLHMAMDAAVSLGVVIAGLLIWWKSWLWIDPITSLMIALVVFIGSWRLFRESLDLMLLAIPASVDLEKLIKLLRHQDGLVSYHDLHIWPISTTEIALSAHLVVTQSTFIDTFSRNLEKKIKENFDISHVTLQLELENREDNCGTQC